MSIFLFLFLIVISLILLLFIHDRFVQKKSLVIVNFPIFGRFRYFFHELRPFFRQYFGDDNAFTSRIVIDWINHVSNGKKGYFSFDKFDSSENFHDDHNEHQMIHSTNPLNKDEMDIVYPIIGKKRKYPMKFKSYIYKSAMSLGAIGFEGTEAMASAFAKCDAPFNTGEGGFSIQHIPNVKFKYQKYFKYHKVSKIFKLKYILIPTKRLKNYYIDFLGRFYLEKNKRDLYLFDDKEFVFYGIDWNAPLSNFPKHEELTKEFGTIIFQIGSGLYGLKGKNSTELNFDRFKKITSFCSGIEIKLAQGAKQSGGILKAEKNSPTIAEIRGVEPYIDLVAPNRFPYYEKGKEKEFFDFIETLSKESGGKPIGIKIVIANETNIEPIAKELKISKNKGPDWITIDGGDGGSGTAPISMSILFGKTIFPALNVVVDVLNKYGVRDKVKIFASSKLYSPHMTARALANGADLIGNARSVMIAGGCIRSGLCSGEFGDCPVGLATMKKSKRRAYSQSMDIKINQIINYVNAQNSGLIEVASIVGVKSPTLLNKTHIPKLSKKI